MSHRCRGSWAEVTVRDDTVRVLCIDCGHYVACQRYYHPRGYTSHMLIDHDDRGQKRDRT